MSDSTWRKGDGRDRAPDLCQKVPGGRGMGGIEHYRLMSESTWRKEDGRVRAPDLCQTAPGGGEMGGLKHQTYVRQYLE